MQVNKVTGANAGGPAHLAVRTPGAGPRRSVLALGPMIVLARFIVITAAFVWCGLPAFAGGSFFLEDIRDLLQQQPALWAHIQSTYDISPTGDADRIGRAQNLRLNGVRVAPYLLWAKPKGTDGEYTFMLEVQAETTYLDARGKKVPIERATDVKEQLKGILFRELKPDERR